MKKYVYIAVAVVVIGAIFFVIGSLQNLNISSEQKTIVTSFYPLAYIVSSIAGNNVKVINIGEGVDPHDSLPSTRDSALLQEATLVILQGAGLETWGEDVGRQLIEADVPVLVVTEHLTLYGKSEGEHDASEDAEEDGHNHGAYDPHTWLDPVLMKDTAVLVRDELQNIDPDNAAVYATNTEILITKLDALDAAYRTGLTHCSASGAIVSHDTLGYVARRYGIVTYAIAGLSTQDEPSVTLLRELREKVTEGVHAILTDATSVQEYSEMFARETDLELISFNPLASGIIENDGDYESGMYANLEAFRLAYDCQ